MSTLEAVWLTIMVLWLAFAVVHFFPGPFVRLLIIGYFYLYRALFVAAYGGTCLMIAVEMHDLLMTYHFPTIVIILGMMIYLAITVVVGRASLRVLLDHSLK